MCVNHRGFQAGVAEQGLDGTDVVACLQKVGGERVAECVGGDFLGDFCLADGKIKRLLEMRFMKMVSPSLSGLHRRFLLTFAGKRRPLFVLQVKHSLRKQPACTEDHSVSLSSTYR